MIAFEIIELTGESSARTFEGDALLIGRADSADILLDRNSVSKNHARIERRGDRYILRDLGSTNGTFLNSRRLRIEAALAPRDRIYIGEIILRVRSIELAPQGDRRAS